MQILNIAGYQFIALSALETLQAELQSACSALSLLGTILLSIEGININLAGDVENIRAVQAYFKNDPRFTEINFHETYSEKIPFQFLKVKIKPEIITLREPSVPHASERAPSIDPEEFKRWLDEKRDITVLDTRNDYEVRFGSFQRAVNLQINHFGEFTHATKDLAKDKPIVMFCTGGIRCEKASHYLLNQGYNEVYQLDGGILGYFAKVGGDYYDGECFIFDERISLNAQLQQTQTVQCLQCQGPITLAEQQLTHYIEKKICPACA